MRIGICILNLVSLVWDGSDVHEAFKGTVNVKDENVRIWNQKLFFVRYTRAINVHEIRDCSILVIVLYV